jgi:hypothetical protein
MPSNIYAQLASFFFLMAAVFTDLLLLRFCLVVANAMLVVASALGFPLWPDYIAPGVAIDSLVWASLALTLHIWAFIRLLLDERPLKPFEDADDEALFQYFNARSGIIRSDFLGILERAEWVRVPEAGRLIPCDDQLYVIVEGAIEGRIKGWKRRPEHVPDHQDVEEIVIGSGELFDLSHANLFGMPIGFYNEGFEARTLLPNALLASWSTEALEEFGFRSPPIVSSAWKNLVAFAVADVAQRHRIPGDTLLRSKRHRDFFPPPHHADKTKKGCWASTKAFFLWIFMSMDPRPPKGLRHYAVPRQFVVDQDLERRPVTGSKS